MRQQRTTGRRLVASLAVAALGVGLGAAAVSATTDTTEPEGDPPLVEPTAAVTDTTEPGTEATEADAEATEAPDAEATAPAAEATEPAAIEKADVDLSGFSFTVGSKEFTEQLILGAITVQVLEDAGADVNDETGLVGSDTVRAALLADEIDMYWEYTGTGWINHLGNTEPVVGEMEQFEAVAEADEENGVVWLDPATFNNTYAIATTAETAEELGIETLSDLTELLEADPDMSSLCAAAEFLNRDDGLPGLEEAYGFEFSDIAELELGLVYTSVDAQDPCVFGEVFGTDGRIAALDLAVLEDDLEFFPSYLPALNIRDDVEGIDELRELFAPVTAALDNDTIQALNARVDVEGEQPEDVARDFLEEVGLIG